MFDRVRGGRSQIRSRRGVPAAWVVVLSAATIVLLVGWVSRRTAPARRRGYDAEKPDAIVIPGGGQTEDGKPQPFVAARLDRALELWRRLDDAQQRRGPSGSGHDASSGGTGGAEGRPPLVVLSAGTMHKPNPRDAAGFPVYEAESEARYLMAKGVPAAAIVEEKLSLDTIGNAWFLRLLHTAPRGWRRLHVVTSDFHLPRTRAIFDWVFGLGGGGGGGYKLSYEGVENRGLSAAAVAEREAREAKSLANVRALAARLTTEAALHAWLHSEHGAYASSRLTRERETVSGAVLLTY